MGSFWETHGFRANPFASYTAEKEPDLERYLVRPAYHQTLVERADRLESFILFGARGAGKSASRIALHRSVLAKVAAATAKQPLPVTFDSFGSIVLGGLDKITAAALVAEVAFLTAEALLVWLAALNDADRDAFLAAMDDDEERLCVWVIQTFYLARPDAVRNLSTRRALELLDQAWPQRTALWVQKKWNQLAVLVGGVAELIAQKVTKHPVGIGGGVAGVLSVAAPSDRADDYAREVLARLVDFVRVFGFSGLLVLIDKVDETDKTTDSASATAQVLHPLLANTGLLEVSGVSWAAFLWDRVRDSYSASGKLPIRLDKIANAEIRWDQRFLSEMLDKRLEYFSDGKVLRFAGLCQASVDSDAMLREIIRCSMNSPRELVRLLDTVVREHEEAFPGVPPPLLDAAAVARGLDKYSVDGVVASYDRTTMAQMARLGLVDFVNKDVQAASRIHPNSARARIKVWCDAGFVAPNGTRSEGRVGKPAQAFTVVDQRLRRVVEHRLWPAHQLDFSLDQPEVGSDVGEEAEDA